MEKKTGKVFSTTTDAHGAFMIVICLVFSLVLHHSSNRYSIGTCARARLARSGLQPSTAPPPSRLTAQSSSSSTGLTYPHTPLDKIRAEQNQISKPPSERQTPVSLLAAGAKDNGKASNRSKLSLPCISGEIEEEKVVGGFRGSEVRDETCCPCPRDRTNLALPRTRRGKFEVPSSFQGPGQVREGLAWFGLGLASKSINSLFFFFEK